VHGAGHKQQHFVTFRQTSSLPLIEGSVGWANSPVEVQMVGNGAIANLPTMQRRESAPQPTLRRRARHQGGCVSASPFCEPRVNPARIKLAAPAP